MKDFYIQLLLCLETIRQKGFIEFLKESIYLNKKIVVTEKNLEADLHYDDIILHDDYDFIEISKQNIGEYDLKFPLKSRQIKIETFVQDGYKCFCIVDGNIVLGDIWYFTYDDVYARNNHRDLKFLQLSLKPREAYMFDMHVLKEKRGGQLVKFLLANALLKLKSSGYNKVFGYYVLKNIPALWVHRIFGYKEIKKLKTNRILFYRASQTV